MERTQYGHVFFVILGLLFIFMLIRNPGPDAMSFFFLICAGILLCFYKITITADEEGVRFSMGIGLIKGEYSYVEIRSCKPIYYTPLGWGVRFRRDATLYNVSGRQAIELEILGETRRVWIGTDVPEELADYINDKLEAYK